MSSQPHRSVPGLAESDAASIVSILEDRLVGLLDLQLVLKHIHWNVVGPNFLSVHEMLDDHVASVRLMSDDVAERIRTLGGVPNGNSGHIVSVRSWDDYPLGRASVFAHLEELDQVYHGVISDHREALKRVGDVDPVTQDLLIEATAKLELYQWFVRSFVERASGSDGEGTTDPRAATRAGTDEAAIPQPSPDTTKGNAMADEPTCDDPTSDEESTQPFNINERTGEPSHRPEHDAARRAVDEQLADPSTEPITPEDVVGSTPR